MKKIISVALAFVLMLSIAVPAFAGTINTSGNQAETTVKVAGSTATSSFIVTIPAEVSIDWSTTSTDVNYTVSNKLETGKCIQVVVSGDGKMVNDENAVLPYTLADTTFRTTAPVVNDAKAAVKVNIATNAWNAAAIDDYTGTLTFTATIEDII